MKIGFQVLGELNVANYVDITKRFDRKRAFTRSGLAVEKSARLKAPVKTGWLRKNVVSTATEKDAEIGVDLNTVPYAIYQEIGTSRMQAHPYLRPALESRRPAIIAIFKDEINKAEQGGK